MCTPTHAMCAFFTYCVPLGPPGTHPHWLIHNSAFLSLQYIWNKDIKQKTQKAENDVYLQVIMLTFSTTILQFILFISMAIYGLKTYHTNTQMFSPSSEDYGWQDLVSCCVSTVSTFSSTCFDTYNVKTFPEVKFAVGQLNSTLRLCGYQGITPVWDCVL